MKNFDEMNEETMNQLILELSETSMYQAILNYIFMRNQLISDALGSIDPFKNPTELARGQGRREGLFDLRDHVELLKKNVREAEEESKRNEQ